MTGRRLALVEAALAEYALPRPDLRDRGRGDAAFTRRTQPARARRVARVHGSARAPGPTGLAKDVGRAGGRRSGAAVRRGRPEAHGFRNPRRRASSSSASSRRSTTDVAEALLKRMHADPRAQHGLRASVVHSVDEAAGHRTGRRAARAQWHEARRARVPHGRSDGLAADARRLLRATAATTSRVLVSHDSRGARRERKRRAARARATRRRSGAGLAEPPVRSARRPARV